MLDHLLEPSHRDDSNKWSNVGFGEEIKQVEFILCTLSVALKICKTSLSHKPKFNLPYSPEQNPPFFLAILLEIMLKYIKRKAYEHPRLHICLHLWEHKLQGSCQHNQLNMLLQYRHANNTTCRRLCENTLHS